MSRSRGTGSAATFTRTQPIFGEYAERLAALGYTAVPLDGKRPLVKNWPELHQYPERLPGLIESSPNANVGILTRGLAVLDADIQDDCVASEVKAYILKTLMPGVRPPLRVGQPPKWLAMFRCAEGEQPKRTSPAYLDEHGREHRLEWLRTGQQFLALGTHPGTGQPVHWPGGSPIDTSTAAEDLPIITEAQIDAIDAEFARIAERAGWRLVRKASTAANDQGVVAPPVAGLTHELARAALESLPAEYADDYHAWVAVGMALHHQFVGDTDAFWLWDSWSQQSEKYLDENATAEKWQSFDARYPDGISMRSVLMEAEEHGWPRPPGVEGAPAAAGDFPELPAEGHWDSPSEFSSIADVGAMPFFQDSEADAANDPLCGEGPARGWPEVDLIDLDSVDVPAPSYIIDPLLPRGVVTLLGAHGGAGKTMVALVQAICVAAGRDFFGYCVERVPVVFYSAEDDADKLRWRIQRICRLLGIPAAELVDWLSVYDVTALDPTLYKEGRLGGRYHGATGMARELRNKTLEKGAGLIIIDNASDVFDANENDRARVRSFMRDLQRMAAEADAAVELIAHIDKASAKRSGTSEGYSGSTAWHNSARSRLFLRAGEEGQLTLEHQKANLSLRASDTHLVWDQGVPILDFSLNKADDGFPHTDKSTEYKRAILEMIDEFYTRGEYIPCSFHAQGNAWKMLKGEAGFPKMDRQTLQRLMRDLERAGDLEKESYKNTYRHERERWRVTSQGRASMAGHPESHADVLVTNQAG